MHRFISLLVLLILGSTTCFAQKSKLEYIPGNIDSLQNYVTTITVKRAQNFKGNDHFKEISKILESQKEGFLKDLKDSSYIFDKRISSYLKSVLREIYKSNAIIAPSDFYFFIDKSPIPNAACWGNGIFTVNLGLFDMVQSDDELAFIICHEMAHQVLKHNDKSMVMHAQTTNSKATKKKINKAASQRYGRRKAVFEVMKNLNYDFLSRSRSAETQADSLGFALFSRTKYNKAAAAQALKKLDLSDSMLFSTDTQLQKHFNFDPYPFKDAWLVSDKTLFDLKEKSDDYAWDKDSLKSHPDIPLRVDRLRKFYAGSDVAATSPTLAAVKKIIAENDIAVSLDESRVDLAMYQVLAQSEKNEISQKDYCNTVAYLLKKTYELKSGHNFGKYVSPVSPFSEEKYLNQVRTFLHNLELKNIRKIGWQFCLKYQEAMKGDTEFDDITSFFSNLNPNN